MAWCTIDKGNGNHEWSGSVGWRGVLLTMKALVHWIKACSSLDRDKAGLRTLETIVDMH